VTSPLSFVASANCGRLAGARISFVDIDPATLNIDVARVPACDALVAVHYAGLPADLSRLPRRPRVVIEDAAHALGAATPDGPVGNCALSDMCVFSFHPVKVITTAEGGAVTTNSDDLATRLRRVRNHGIVPMPEIAPWHYDVETIGFNYRLSDIHAALGRSQLHKLERFISRREQIALRYRQELSTVPLELPPEPSPGFRHAYHLFPVRVSERRRVQERLRQAGVATQVHFIPIYRHAIYRDPNVSPASFPETERAFDQLLSLPMFPALQDAEQDLVVAALKAAL
jgi:dTDP-4-amino-4,6-dideoxygalactose transaminase